MIDRQVLEWHRKKDRLGKTVRGRESDVLTLSDRETDSWGRERDRCH